MRFVELVVQLVDLDAGFFHGLSAGTGDAVNATPAATRIFEGGFEQAGTLQSVKERIESAGADPVTVMLELLHHRQAEDRLVRGMDEHVNADEPVKEFPMVIRHILEYISVTFFSSCLLSKFDITCGAGESSPNVP